MGGKIRVGFVGCGRVSDNHYQALLLCENAQLVAVSDLNREIARSKARKWKVDEMSCEEICERKDLDALFILTPPHTHFAYVERALLHGKHVLVEKPVSFELDEITRMRDLARMTGKVCMPGHSYLYLPELQRAKRIVQEGEIGMPLLFYFSEIYFMPPELARKYLGPLGEVLWHHIYLMLAFLGVPRRVHAFKTCLRRREIPTGDEQVMVNAEYASGALAHLCISWALEDETSDPWTFKLKLLGTDGGIHFSRRDVVSKTSNGKPPWEYPLYQEMFNWEVNYFVNRCVLEGSSPPSSLVEAEWTLKILQAIQESLSSGCAQNVENVIR
ncbi:MAG: hypothetical protein PWP42_317 [Candidatus Atribacteria bacterium]|nr:hypothetical protein [Candidatus Atribacteria bacterium]